MPDSVPSSSALSLAELKDLLAAFDASDTAELSLTQGDFKLRLRKPGTRAVAPVVLPASNYVQSPLLSAPATPTLAATPSVNDVQGIKGFVVNSPMVGTFYRSPAPESPPFIEVGDRVVAGQTVCIIEAMKLMNEIEAEHAGRVAKILVQNGDAVEYGQALIEIQPD